MPDIANDPLGGLIPGLECAAPVIDDHDHHRMADDGAPPAKPRLTAPANLSAEAGETYVNLSWDPVAGAASYDVYRDGKPVGHHVRGTKFTDSHLSANTAYGYTVCAVSSTGAEGPASEAQATTREGAVANFFDELVTGQLGNGNGHEDA